MLSIFVEKGPVPALLGDIVELVRSITPAYMTLIDPFRRWIVIRKFRTSDSSCDQETPAK
jgi:hypothetical protein